MRRLSVYSSVGQPRSCCRRWPGFALKLGGTPARAHRARAHHRVTSRAIEPGRPTDWEFPFDRCVIEYAITESKATSYRIQGTADQNIECRIGFAVGTGNAGTTTTGDPRPHPRRSPAHRSQHRRLAPIGLSKWNVSLELAVAPAVAWPAELIDVTQPAMRRMPGRTPLVLAACSRAIHAA